MSLVTMVTVLMRSTCGHFQICVHFETNRYFNNSGKYLCVVLVTVCGISVHRTGQTCIGHNNMSDVQCGQTNCLTSLKKHRINGVFDTGARIGQVSVKCWVRFASFYP